MKLIHRGALRVAQGRQRRAFPLDKQNELADSIRKNGLFHPLVLRVEGEEYVLVSGERRLRAINDIYDLEGSFKHDGETVRTDFIPYSLINELGELEVEEAELSENIHRENLTWQERADASSRLMALRTKLAKRDNLAPPTIEQIQEETTGTTSPGGARDNTRKELLVAKHLSDPDVREAKSLDEAFKVIVKKEEQKKNALLGESVGRIFTADLHRCFNTDAKRWLRECPAEQFDIILTDPPYGMGADEFGDSGGRAAGAHGYVDSYANFKELMDVFIPQSVRVTKARAHLYLFCDLDGFYDLRLWLSEAGWHVHRTPLTWFKRTASRTPWPGKGPQRKTEWILFAEKGGMSVQRTAGDLLEFSSDENLGHGAQKPVELFKDLLSRSALPGMRVLDICAGTGTIFPAAHDFKVAATGLEVDESSYGIAVKRIQSLKELV